MENPAFIADTSDEEYVNQPTGSSDEEESVDGNDTIASSLVTDFSEEADEVKQNPKEWDLFQTFPDKRNQEATNELWQKVNVGSKIFLCVIFFLIILATSLITKLTFIVIAYNINITSNDVVIESSKTNYTLKGGTMVTEVQWIWAMVLIIIAPYVFNVAKCLHRLCFKKVKKMKWKYLPLTLLIETIHSVGLGIFVYIASPSGDAIYTLYIFQGVSLIPAVLKCLPSYRAGKSTSGTIMIIAFFSVMVHAGFLVVIGYTSHSMASTKSYWLIPIAMVFISVNWFENFVPRTGESKSTHQGFLERIANRLRHTKLDFCGMLLKPIITFFIPIIIFAPGHCEKTLFLLSPQSTGCSLLGNITLVSQPERFTTPYLPLILAGVNILSSIIGFKVAKTACVIRSQIPCFTLPLILVTPLSFVVILLSYKYHFIQDIFGSHVAWPVLRESASWIDFLNGYTTSLYLPVMFMEFVNLLFTVDYIWKPSSERIASTAMLFVKPLYCGIVFDQSLLLNRSSDDDIVRKKHEKQMDQLKKELKENTLGNAVSQTTSPHKEKVIPKIYACATLWRENEEEMTQLLKSIFRMDMDQFDKKFEYRLSDKSNRDIYEFEAHIFFDDAFYHDEDDGDKYKVNSYVLQFLKVLPLASSAVYMSSVKLMAPYKYLTPYGGRFEWTTPGDNKLVVHFKDKKKIRVKKRWSQVMYMYYLLSYRIIDNKSISHTKKFSTASNTFILALDGDIDFYPDSVHLLLDRMRKDTQLGAAAGRIHPKGSGPMVWYQKFEYSVSHWLQKTTEHKLGCVLCSPGCFSLFRGSALLQHNVINKYATIPSQAHEYVQFDMGEDRWLCTLLLQAGKRIEYCAAADASTFCPEGFSEFYKQRRRWTPSTMANIIDLLSSGNTLRKNNPNVSVLYIMYQVFLFVSSILTPGTIFLLILGAFNTAYPTVPLYAALILNLIPVVLFIILCYSANDKVQLGYAAIMSTIYSLVMMIVIVGLIKQIVESQFCSVTAIFFLGVVGIFVVSALFHPREILNIFHGVIYFLTIPSSSMLLIIYALGNLNNGSWGTRDSNSKPTSTEIPEDTTNDTDARNKLLKLGALSPNTLFETIRTKFSSDYVFSFGNLFRCMCCPSGQVKEEDVKMKAILEKLESVEDQIDDLKDVVRGKTKTPEDEWNNLPYLAPDTENQPFSSMASSFVPSRRAVNPLFQSEDREMPMDDTKWINEPYLNGSVDILDREELNFWTEFIQKYMTPEEMSKEKKERIAQDLGELRNKVCLFFFLLNALFITIIFILESVSRYSPGLTIQLPCDEGGAGQKIEPISIAFTLIFGILLVLQFICMLFHRVTTLIHIASSTDIHIKKTKLDLEKERHQAIDTYNMGRRRDSLESIATINSFTSDDEGTYVNTMEKKERTFISKLIKDSRRKEVTKHKLIDLYTDKTNNFVKTLEKIDNNATDKEIEISAKRKFRSMPAKSIKTIIEMAKDDKYKQSLKEKNNALRMWKVAKAKTIRPKSAFSTVVDQAFEQNKKLMNSVSKIAAENEDVDNSEPSTSTEDETRPRKKSVQFSTVEENKNKSSKTVPSSSKMWSKLAANVVNVENTTSPNLESMNRKPKDATDENAENTTSPKPESMNKKPNDPVGKTDSSSSNDNATSTTEL